MYTAETSDEKKQEILEDLACPTGSIRVIVSTTALSMGINIAGMSFSTIIGTYKQKMSFVCCHAEILTENSIGCKYVIMLGMPDSFESYVQKSGLLFCII